MGKEMRKNDRSMNEAAIVELLRMTEYGVLSMAGLDSYAYGVPLSYVFLNGALYFHSALEGYKLDCIQENNQVSFCVVGETEILPSKFSTKYQSVIVFGQITVIEGAEKREALIGFLKKYSSEFMEKGLKYLESDEHITRVLKLTIEDMSGKARR